MTPALSSSDLTPERYVSWPLVAFGLSFAFLVIGGDYLLRDSDTLWHVATGRWILEHGAVPTVDPFSHTMPGAPWHAHEWLSAILLATAHGLGDWAGVVMLTALAAAGALALMVRALLIYLRPFYAWALVLLSFLVLMPHLLARPHTLVMPVMVIWLASLVSARAENRAPALPMVLFMVVWANLHGSFIIGLCLAGVLALEGIWAVKSRPDCKRLATSWTLFLFLAGLGALATPHGIDGFFFPFQVRSMEKSLAWILEWRSPNFQKPQPLAFWIIFSLAVALYRGLRVPPFRLLLLLGFIYLALAYARHADLIGLFVPLLLAPCLEAQWPDTAAKQPVQSSTSIFRGAAIVLGIAAVGALTLHVRGVVPARAITPTTALEAARQAGLHGPVFNDYDFGGYLIYSGIRTFIDGRADMYGDVFVDQILRASNVVTKADSLLQLLNEYGVTWTLARPDGSLVRQMDQLLGWQRVHVDAVAVVHARVN